MGWRKIPSNWFRGKLYPLIIPLIEGEFGTQLRESVRIIVK